MEESENLCKLYLEPVCPLFWWLNPPKQGLFQGFQVWIRLSKLYGMRHSAAGLKMRRGFGTMMRMRRCGHGTGMKKEVNKWWTRMMRPR